MMNKKYRNFSFDEKDEIVKQIDEFQITKVVFALLKGIPMTILQSILQKKVWCGTHTTFSYSAL